MAPAVRRAAQECEASVDSTSVPREEDECWAWEACGRGQYRRVAS